MGKLVFTLDGTDSFHALGLRYNPFPQIAESGKVAAMLALNSLGGDPIPDTDYIRKTLGGHFTEEFIESVCKRFVKGARITCTVTYPD